VQQKLSSVKELVVGDYQIKDLFIFLFLNFRNFALLKYLNMRQPTIHLDKTSLTAELFYSAFLG